MSPPHIESDDPHTIPGLHQRNGDPLNQLRECAHPRRGIPDEKPCRVQQVGVCVDQTPNSDERSAEAGCECLEHSGDEECHNARTSQRPTLAGGSDRCPQVRYRPQRAVLAHILLLDGQHTMPLPASRRVEAISRRLFLGRVGLRQETRASFVAIQRVARNISSVNDLLPPTLSVNVHIISSSFVLIALTYPSTRAHERASYFPVGVTDGEERE